MSNRNTSLSKSLNLPTLSGYFKQILTTIMVVFPLALLVDPLISPIITGLPSFAIAMIFVLIMSPIMTILMPIVTKLLEKTIFKFME